MPPASDSSTLSASSWPPICQRLAPRAVRNDNSRSRASARAIDRLATLAQAMSSTSSVAPISTISIGRALRVSSPSKSTAVA